MLLTFEGSKNVVDNIDAVTAKYPIWVNNNNKLSYNLKEISPELLLTFSFNLGESTVLFMYLASFLALLGDSR